MDTLADNRKARFDNEITEHYEAGVELNGYEVKRAADFKLSARTCLFEAARRGW
jgi:tmRNA-binding protein